MKPSKNNTIILSKQFSFSIVFPGHFRHQKDKIIELWTYINVKFKTTNRNYPIMNFEISHRDWHFF